MEDERADDLNVRPTEVGWISRLKVLTRLHLLRSIINKPISIDIVHRSTHVPPAIYSPPSSSSDRLQDSEICFKNLPVALSYIET